MMKKISGGKHVWKETFCTTAGGNLSQMEPPKSTGQARWRPTMPCLFPAVGMVFICRVFRITLNLHYVFLCSSFICPSKDLNTTFGKINRLQLLGDVAWGGFCTELCRGLISFILWREIEHEENNLLEQMLCLAIAKAGNDIVTAILCSCPD